MSSVYLYWQLTLLILQLVKSDTIIQTNSGPVRGVDIVPGNVEAFLGIPFSEPPVGHLRFAKPVRKTWEGVYNATRLPPPCIQTSLGNEFFLPDLENMSEDCLYLNLWVPKSGTTDSKKKTIMVFIHGGGFITGSNSMKIYDGAKLSEYGDVIVATINYRVGCLGFFAGFTDDAPGNLAFHDQVMAIKWIKENANHFNGDPDNIVLFGESSGAYSISMHQISPLSKNLFKRVIQQSGSILNPIYSNDNNTKLYGVSKLYSEILGCASGNGTLENKAKDVVDCLRRVPAERFAEADREVVMERANPLWPRVGDDFLPEDITGSFQKGLFKDTEVLLGTTKDEGTLLIVMGDPAAFGKYGEKDITKIFNETSTPIYMKSFLGNEDSAENKGIIRSYLDRVNDATGYTYGKAFSEFFGDAVITCAKIFQAEIQSTRDNPVYFYVFDHRPSSTPYAEWMGVAHFDEVQFVFGNPMNKYFTENEIHLSREVMDMWTTFAKTGNPNKPGCTRWPRYTPSNPKYLIIRKQDSIGVRPDNYRCEKWRNRFLPKI